MTPRAVIQFVSGQKERRNAVDFKTESLYFQPPMLQQKTYQAKQSGPHFFETQGPNAPKWYIVDAKDQVVGRLATIISRVILGKHKTTFTRHADAGDFVVVIKDRKSVV